MEAFAPIFGFLVKIRVLVDCSCSVSNFPDIAPLPGIEDYLMFRPLCAPRRQSFRPYLEHLEARELLNAAPIAVNDAYRTTEDAPLVVAASTGVLANDSDPDSRVLRATVASGPAHGTLALKADGSFVYTPAAGYFGTDTFTYRASDGRRNSTVSAVTITVQAINAAPVAVDDAFQVDENRTLSGAVLTNDRDPDGDPLSAALVSGPNHGTLVLNANGSFTYTPNAGYYGSDGFTYQALDPAGAASVAAVAITVNPVNDFSAVTARLEEAVSTGKLPGVGLIIVDGAEVLYEEAFGNQTVDTQLFIASASKLTSATVLMTLVDDGLIALDDPIAMYLPQFTTAVGAITIRQLLSQTHGLPGNHRSLNAPGEDNGLTLEASVNMIAADFASGRLQPVRPAGTAFDYSPGISYQILGRIAEVATGQTWDVLWHERVGDPAQMTNTTYGDTNNPRLAGGMASTLADYGRLLQIFVNGGTTADGVRILSEAAVAEMLKNQVAGLPFSGSQAMETEGYGLSWWHNEMDVVLSVPGAYGAIPWIDVARGYAGFLLTYDVLGASVPVWEDIEPLIRAELSAPALAVFGPAADLTTNGTAGVASVDALVVSALAGPLDLPLTHASGKHSSVPRVSDYLADSAPPLRNQHTLTTDYSPSLPGNDLDASKNISLGSDPFSDRLVRGWSEFGPW